MLTTPNYNIDAGSNFSTLSDESWKVFSPFLSRIQWADNDPSHSPRKTEIIHAILNRGKPGACTFWRPEGKGYKYILPVLHPRHFEKAIKNRRKIYYVSFGSHALLYFDIDLHYAWQTLAEGQEAKRLIDDLLCDFFGKSVLFWSTSSRGLNGYLKVDLQEEYHADANALFDRLQKALELFLADQQNLADFEIKGKLGFLGEDEYHWAQYGKLPIHADDWNLTRLAEFKSIPPVPLRSLGVLCQAVERAIPQDILIQHRDHKKSLGDQPIIERNCFLVTPAIEKALLEKHGDAWRYMFAFVSEDKEGSVWLDLRYYRPGETPITERELRDQAKTSISAAITPVAPPVAAPVLESLVIITPVKVATSPTKVNLSLEDLASEPDSFKRQKEALFQFARYLKRVPTLQEALDLIKDKNLFSGSWAENQAKRKTRVRDILRFIARTFDPSKCAKGSVNVGKFDEWAVKKFPKGIVGNKARYLTEDGQIVEGCQGVRVGSDFIAVFMAICEFALLIDKNQDDTLPHRRAKGIWNALSSRGLISVPFSDRKWAICREELNSVGIINIVDRNFSPGKAMKWDADVYFPGLGMWKVAKQLSMMGPGVLRWKEERKEKEHNTLLHWQPAPQISFVGVAPLKTTSEGCTLLRHVRKDYETTCFDRE